MNVSIEDCQLFMEEYVNNYFIQDIIHEYYIHKDNYNINMFIKIKERNFMPTYYIYDNEVLDLMTESPFEAKEHINRKVRLGKINKILK